MKNKDLNPWLVRQIIQCITLFCPVDIPYTICLNP